MHSFCPHRLCAGENLIGPTPWMFLSHKQQNLGPGQWWLIARGLVCSAWWFNHFHRQKYFFYLCYQGWRGNHIKAVFTHLFWCIIFKLLHICALLCAGHITSPSCGYNATNVENFARWDSHIKETSQEKAFFFKCVWFSLLLDIFLLNKFPMYIPSLKNLYILIFVGMKWG